ncbi:zinc finger MYM-type 3-like [Paramuricea clavata]|uniref:Zinc finger MYM-type 3-like n=1 Tax=Paramuricea clavata TaxID=317549 RepID=A0A7D9DBB5_PARCT|nr:zinc finger MYM-type 3-like [Paramuricea clavata]
MASSCKKRRFRDPQSVERSIDNVRNAIPQTTRYKNRWGVRIFEDSQSGRENKAVMCESNPFSLDLQNLQNLETELCSMTARTLNFWLIKFVQEVCDKDGKPYPGRTVYQIICSLKRHLDKNGRAEANMLNANNHCFQTFRRVLDSEMKATHREGESLAENRTRREKEAIIQMMKKPKEDEKFQISDEELDKFLSEVDWSKIDKEVLDVQEPVFDIVGGLKACRDSTSDITEQYMADARIYVKQKGVSRIEEFLKKKLEGSKDVKIRFAITGNSGTGKSAYINAIRG